jgi:hypothetical protein
MQREANRLEKKEQLEARLELLLEEKERREANRLEKKKQLEARLELLLEEKERREEKKRREARLEARIKLLLEEKKRREAAQPQCNSPQELYSCSPDLNRETMCPSCQDRYDKDKCWADEINTNILNGFKNPQ